MIRILSLGAGVQSSTLALMIAAGGVAPIDAAIFADTGAEPDVMAALIAYVRDCAAAEACDRE